MTKPLVSVLMPVYNGGPYLRAAVESILRQTYSHLEIIVIDDGSTDGSLDLLAGIPDPRIQVITQQNAGRAGAMNRGLAQLSGDFYIAQDADDISHPRRVQRQVECLLDHPDVAAVFTGHELILGDKKVAPRTAAKTVEACRQDIERFRMPAHGPTPMYRVALVRDIRFEPSLRVAEDLDYILQIGERYPMLVLGECLYSYRVYVTSSSRVDPARNRRMELKAIERACRRRGLDPAAYAPPPHGSSVKFAHRRREQVVPHFMESVLDARRAGDWRGALRIAAACLRLHAWDPYYYKPLAYAVLPLAVVDWYRQKMRKQENRHARETKCPQRPFANCR